jgi:hypothetical protein
MSTDEAEEEEDGYFVENKDEKLDERAMFNELVESRFIDMDTELGVDEMNLSALHAFHQ